MMSVLDALRYKLTPPGTTDLEGEPLDPRIQEMTGPRPLPPGLPLVVQDQIRNQPSYQEGGKYAPRDFGGEQNIPSDDPRNRDYRLNDMIDWAEYMRRRSQYAWPEDKIPGPLEPGQSPFATPEGPSPGMDYLPGGATKISAGQGLLRTAPSRPMPQGDPAGMAEEMLARMRADPSLVPSMNRVQGTPTPPQTVFGETDRIPPEAAGRGYQTLGLPLFDQELMARLLGPRRHQQLFDDIQGGRELAREGVWPMPEGDVQSFSPNSPFSSPLNQMLRRGPFGQY